MACSGIKNNHIHVANQKFYLDLNLKKKLIIIASYNTEIKNIAIAIYFLIKKYSYA